MTLDPTPPLPWDFRITKKHSNNDVIYEVGKCTRKSSLSVRLHVLSKNGHSGAVYIYEKNHHIDFERAERRR
jgi:hypothetical protein